MESKIYTVMKKGAFLFHEDGTWEKLDDKGALPPYVNALSLDEDETIVDTIDESVMA